MSVAECRKVTYIGKTGIRYLCPYKEGHDGPCQDPRDPRELLKFLPRNERRNSEKAKDIMKMAIEYDKSKNIGVQNV